MILLTQLEDKIMFDESTYNDDDAVEADTMMDVVYELEVSKGAKIRNRYNQVPHLTQDTNGKVTNSQ